MPLTALEWVQIILIALAVMLNGVIVGLALWTLRLVKTKLEIYVKRSPSYGWELAVKNLGPKDVTGIRVMDVPEYNWLSLFSSGDFGIRDSLYHVLLWREGYIQAGEESSINIGHLRVSDAERRSLSKCKAEDVLVIKYRPVDRRVITSRVRVHFDEVKHHVSAPGYIPHL